MCNSIPASGPTMQAFDDAWVSTQGQVSPPDAPSGGGGSGHFAVAGYGSGDEGDLPHPRSPAARRLDPLDVHQVAEQLQAAARRNPPPRVTQTRSETIGGVRVTVQADSSGARDVGEALTGQAYQLTGAPTWRENGGVITSFTNNIVIHVTIHTRYGTGNPHSPSAYGRGTTDSDRGAGDVSLGFHESCHRSAFLNYLRNTPQPVFGGRVGMSVAEFQEAEAEYRAAWEPYFAASWANSIAITDEVGSPTKSTWCRDNPGRCLEP